MHCIVFIAILGCSWAESFIRPALGKEYLPMPSLGKEAPKPCKLETEEPTFFPAKKCYIPNQKLFMGCFLQHPKEGDDFVTCAGLDKDSKERLMTCREAAGAENYFTRILCMGVDPVDIAKMADCTFKHETDLKAANECVYGSGDASA